MPEDVKQFAPGVVEVPGRKFPGIVLMGDTVASMASSIDQVLEALKHQHGFASDSFEVDRLEYVLVRFKEHMTAYETALNKLGMPLPYPLEKLRHA